jgi:hypothetical protein
VVELAMKNEEEAIRDFYRHSAEDRQLLVEVGRALAAMRTIGERRAMVRVLQSYNAANQKQKAPALRLVVG